MWKYFTLLVSYIQYFYSMSSVNLTFEIFMIAFRKKSVFLSIDCIFCDLTKVICFSRILNFGWFLRIFCLWDYSNSGWRHFTYPFPILVLLISFWKLLDPLERHLIEIVKTGIFALFLILEKTIVNDMTIKYESSHRFLTFSRVRFGFH